MYLRPARFRPSWDVIPTIIGTRANFPDDKMFHGVSDKNSAFPSLGTSFEGLNIMGSLDFQF